MSLTQNIAIGFSSFFIHAVNCTSSDTHNPDPSGKTANSNQSLEYPRDWIASMNGLPSNNPIGLPLVPA